MSDAIYRTREGDMLDYICWKHYGEASGMVEQVLEKNPGLAAKGPIYQENELIILPLITKPVVKNVINIWD